MEFISIPRARDLHKKRVAAYCRVSTGRENQEDSLATQVNYYTDYIRSHPAWEWAGVYWDEKSGTRAGNRPGFQQLLRDALAGKVDFILVKSISRWARNLVDAGKYIRLMQGNGVDLYFENEGLDTANPACGFMLSLLSAIAQDESRSISENVKWSYQKRFRQGCCNLGNHRILGYDSVNGQLIPNQDAETVRRIFGLSGEGLGYAAIARQLQAEGRRGKNGAFLTDKGVRYILRNEIYVGDRRLQKQPPKNFLTKQPDPRATYESYYLKDDHEGIIDRALWEKIQGRIKRMEQ